MFSKKAIDLFCETVIDSLDKLKKESVKSREASRYIEQRLKYHCEHLIFQQPDQTSIIDWDNLTDSAAASQQSSSINTYLEPTVYVPKNHRNLLACVYFFRKQVAKTANFKEVIFVSDNEEISDFAQVVGVGKCISLKSLKSMKLK